MFTVAFTESRLKNTYSRWWISPIQPPKTPRVFLRFRDHGIRLLKGKRPHRQEQRTGVIPNITDTQNTAGEASNPSAGTQETPTTPQPDPVSGLITDEYGNLIDPETGGTVDPETGAIRDTETGQFVGLADQYLNNVVCAVS